MATQVLMPQLGEAVEEAVITRWLKNEGDYVEEFEALVEVNTDKVDTEIPAPASGTLLKILQPKEGAIIKAGMVLAWIGEAGEPIPTDERITTDEFIPEEKPLPELSRVEAAPRELATSETNTAPHISPDRNSDRYQGSGFISPVVAKIAAEHRVNLQLIQGTGLNGRITKRDVLNYIEGSQISSRQAPGEKLTPQTVRSIPDTETPDTTIPHTNLRRRIAEHMVLSKRTSPHVTTVFEADLSKVVRHREANKELFARDGINLTYTVYFVAAAALALKSFPLANSSWSEEGVILHRTVNIGMATSLGEEGLIVPVIKHADELSLLGLARSVNDLANRARGKQLRPDEVKGGTFTITNHGVSGSLLAMPIINQPQCAILGVGKLQKRVVVLADDSGYDTIAVRPMAYLTLTFDHRILDGAVADYFLAKVVNTLENWT